jgi:spermidine synthase
MPTYRSQLNAEPHNAINKWSHYPEIYDEIFQPYHESCTSVLEIGVQNGGSLQLLARMFPNAQLHGLDVNPLCAKLNGTLGDRVRVLIGDATNPKVLATLPAFDVIIDDGAHIPQVQAVSFAYLFQHKLSANGVYVIEDVEHSYQDWWRAKTCFALGNFFDFVRDRIDDMHLVYTNPGKAKQNPYSLGIRKIEVFHGVVVFYKGDSLKIPASQWWEGKRII